MLDKRNLNTYMSSSLNKDIIIIIIIMSSPEPKAFLWEKVKTVDFSETIAASYLKASRFSHLIEYMKVCEY